MSDLHPALADPELVRVELRRVACHEIFLLARAAQRFIESGDVTGEVSPVTRGMMLRISNLSEAISGANDPEEDPAGPDVAIYGEHHQR